MRRIFLYPYSYPSGTLSLFLHFLSPIGFCSSVLSWFFYLTTNFFIVYISCSSSSSSSFGVPQGTVLNFHLLFLSCTSMASINISVWKISKFTSQPTTSPHSLAFQGPAQVSCCRLKFILSNTRFSF